MPQEEQKIIQKDWISIVLNPNDIKFEKTQINIINEQIIDCWDERHDEDKDFIPFDERFPSDPLKIEEGTFFILNDLFLLKEILEEINERIALFKDNIAFESWDDEEEKKHIQKSLIFNKNLLKKLHIILKEKGIKIHS